jgi:hypothetical protein
MGSPSSGVAVHCLRLQANIKSASRDGKETKQLFEAWQSACVFLQKQLPLLGSLEASECKAVLQTLNHCLQCATKVNDARELAVFQQAMLAYQVLRQLCTQNLFHHVLSLGILVLEFLIKHMDFLPPDKAVTLRYGTLVALGAALPHSDAIPSSFLRLSELCLSGQHSCSPDDSHFVQRLVLARTKVSTVPLDQPHLHGALNLLCHTFKDDSPAMLRLLPIIAKATSLLTVVAFCNERDPMPSAAIHAALLPHMLAELARAAEGKVNTAPHKPPVVTVNSFQREALRIHHCLWGCINTKDRDEATQEAINMQSENMESVIGKLANDTSHLLTAVLMSCAGAIEAAATAKDLTILRSLQMLLPALKALTCCALEREHQREPSGFTPDRSEILAAAVSLASVFASAAGTASDLEALSYCNVLALATKEVLDLALGDLEIPKGPQPQSGALPAFASALKFVPFSAT